jgi:ferric-dicitrate binding protein FerR (iron transport regulator)
MNTRRDLSDPLTVITALRPRPEEDAAWTQQERAALLTRVLHSPRPWAPSRPSRLRRRTLTLGLSGVLVVAGGGAAVAGGLVPQAFVDAFAYWQNQPSGENSPPVDPSTAERAATAPGPGGTVFTVVSAHAADDPSFRCTTALFETPESAAQPGPAVFTDAFGSVCEKPSHRTFGDGTNVAVTDGKYVWQIPAGDAVRGELRTASGEDWPVVLVDGSFYGWFPALEPGEPHPVLVGYAADGSEVGRTSV